MLKTSPCLLGSFRLWLRQYWIAAIITYESSSKNNFEILNRVTIAAYAKDTFHIDVLFCLKVPEPPVELFDDSLDARRVLILCNLAGALRSAMTLACSSISASRFRFIVRFALFVPEEEYP